MSKKQLKDFITHEQNRLDKERAQRFEDLGYKPLMTFEVGTTKIKLLPTIPRPFKSSWGVRKAFRIEYNGAEADWPVSERSPIYRDLLGLLEAAPVVVNIVRTGTGKQTRWAIQT